MVQDIFKEVVVRIGAMLTGHNECRGMFKVVDENGNPVEGVEVDYRIGDSNWTPCGVSSTEEYGKNFSQRHAVFYSTGEPVVWRFFKPGYSEVTVTRYMAGKEFDEASCTVVLHRAEPVVSRRPANA